MRKLSPQQIRCKCVKKLWQLWKPKRRGKKKQPESVCILVSSPCSGIRSVHFSSGLISVFASRVGVFVSPTNIGNTRCTPSVGMPMVVIHGIKILAALRFSYH